MEELLPVINQSDRFVFLGDCTGDVYSLRNKITVPTTIVSGNCDIIKAYPEEEVFQWKGHAFFVTHGHRYHVKRDMLNIIYAAKEQNCDCAIFGHTHVSLVQSEMGVLLVNPGSIAEPRLCAPSYCIISEEKGNIFPKIIVNMA